MFYREKWLKLNGTSAPEAPTDSYLEPFAKINSWILGKQYFVFFSALLQYMALYNAENRRRSITVN
jgi:hypothetical protein